MLTPSRAYLAADPTAGRLRAADNAGMFLSMPALGRGPLLKDKDMFLRYGIHNDAGSCTD